MDRRRFLQGLGLAGAATGLSSLGLRMSMAEPGEGPPKRLIIISHCHGWPHDSWKMRPSGTSEGETWERDLSALSAADFSAALAPLYAHRKRMLALDGLSLATAELDSDGNRHDTGWVHAWTGNYADFSSTDTRAQSASLDQLVAAKVARSDRLPSLEISVDDVRESGRPISYNVSGARLPVESSPARLWQRLFGPSVAPSPLAARQRGVLDYAYAEHKAMASKVDKRGRERLDAHYELVRRLGDRIEGMASLSCDPVPERKDSLANYNERFDAFSELIGAALSCDVTRVVSLSLGEMPTSDFGWDHLTDDVHKGLAHDIYNDPQKHQAMTDYVALHSGQVARLVSVLEGLPDTDGGSVMDNTLIVWGSELADGWHGYRHYNPVIIGGSWHFRTGRYLHWPHETPVQMLVPASVDPSGYSQVSGMPHQHLLVSAAQAMGLSIDHVGLEHVQGQSGELVKCDGPVPELT